MKPEFETQRKVESFFAGKNDENSIWIRDGLYTLISDVLFVPDTKEKDKYHPRIGIQRDFIFRSLSDTHAGLRRRFRNDSGLRSIRHE